MGKRDGPITNGDKKRIGATQQSNETGGRLKKTEQENAGAATPGSRRRKRGKQIRRGKPEKTGVAKRGDEIGGHRNGKTPEGGADQRNNRLKNRVDATGQKQPGGRNRQDAWAIRKNRKNR